MKLADLRKLIFLLAIGQVAIAQTHSANQRVVLHPPKDVSQNPEEIGVQYSGTPTSATLSLQPVPISLPLSGFYGSEFMMSPTSDPADRNSIFGLALDDNAQSPTPGLRVLHSSDAGTTWEILTTLDKRLYDPQQDSLYSHLAVETNAQGLILGTSVGVFLSKDFGRSFFPLADSTAAAAIDVKLSLDGNKLAVAYQKNIEVELFEKINGNWRKSLTQPASLHDFITAKLKDDPNNYYSDGDLYSVQFDPLVPNVLYAGMGRGVFRYSADTGWSILKGVFNDSTVYNIDVVPQTGELFISSCNGVYFGNVDHKNGEIPDDHVVLKKARSNSFVNQGTGAISPTYLRTFDVEVNPQDSREVVTTSASGVYLSRDSGSTWKRISNLPERDPVTHTLAEFRSAIWLADGGVIVSGLAGTFHFKP